MKLLTIITKKIKNLFQKKKQSEYEVTKYVFSDRQPIEGSSTISFFVNTPEPDISVTRTFESEDEAVN
jgi:hypothetical protein